MADTSELAAIEQVVQRLKDNVEDELETTLKRHQPTAEKTVERQAKRLIEAQADVGKLGEKPDQQSLYNSFGSYVSKSQTKEGLSGKLVVGSDAPHAAALNQGTSPHEIYPSEAERLVFEGAPGDEYSTSIDSIAAVRYNRGDDGGDLVIMREGAPVNHPGVSKTSYFEISLRQIEQKVSNKLSRNISKAIIESGFKPATK